MSRASAISTTSPSPSGRSTPTRDAPSAWKVTSLTSRPRSRRRVASEPLADEPGAFAHQVQDLLLDLDLLLAGPAQGAEEPALRREDRVGDKRADLQQPGDAAARELLLGVARVVRPPLDHEPAHALGPGECHVFRDVKHIASIAGEDDVLLVRDEARLRE